MVPEDRWPEIVEVATESRTAFGRPCFIVKKGERYFVAIASLEYDPNASGITQEQKEGVAQVAQLFRGGADAALGAVELSGPPPSAMNTGPRPKLAGP